MDSELAAWRILRGETPTVVESGDIAREYAYARAYESGDRWAYSDSLEWTGLLVARLTERNLRSMLKRISQSRLVLPHLRGIYLKDSHRAKYLEHEYATRRWHFHRWTNAHLGERLSCCGRRRRHLCHRHICVLVDLLKDEATLFRKSSVE
jgi:hypothetical protein